MGTLPKRGRVETVAAATPEAIWSVLADPTRLGEWSHETSEGVWLDGATSARPGARYRAGNRTGRFAWTRENEIIAADAPRELVWRTVQTRKNPDCTEWRITLDAVDGGTRIVQTFEIMRIHPLLDRLYWLMVRAHRDRSAALEADLRRLGDVAAATQARTTG